MFIVELVCVCFGFLVNVDVLVGVNVVMVLLSYVLLECDLYLCLIDVIEVLLD